MPEANEKPSRTKKAEKVEEKKVNGNGNSIYSQFDKLISAVAPAKIALFTHKGPDPDAIGSMMGLSWFFTRKYGLESKGFYTGDISHPQNNVMCNLLDPGLAKIEEYDPEDYKLAILVDTVPCNAGVGEHDIKFDIVIDHHREVPVEYSGLFINKKLGSCAATVYDIIKHINGVKFDDDVDLDLKTATSLIVGIMTDTNFLLSDDATELDRLAFNELFQYRNAGFLHQIIFFKRPKFWIDTKAAACTSASIDDEGYAIVGLGIIPEKQRDLIADMAEEMVSWLSVETAIAFGVVGGDRIEGSVRSLNATLSVPELCRRLGGEEGSGGGKLSKGAYRLPLSPKIDGDEDEEDVQLAWNSINAREVKRILRLVKK